MIKQFSKSIGAFWFKVGVFVVLFEATESVFTLVELDLVLDVRS